MAELEIHHEGHESDPAGKTVGVLAAVLAVFLAIVTIASHRSHTAAIISRTEANDNWAHYQANRMKLHNLELGEEILTAVAAKGNGIAEIRADYGKQKEKYDKQSQENFDKATESTNASKAEEARALRFDIGEGLLEIGLVLTSLYFISRKKMFPVMGVLAGAAGTVFAVAGLFV